MKDERLEELLKAALPPIEQTEPKRDLWPSVRRRIDEQTTNVPLLDWALIAAVIVWIVTDPMGALALLYHL